ncbi:hypothetical protein [Streptomyces sp. NPDC002088]|uniref:hypothetical protein n=1 Tax=Streptomyces sp. NPDC002088 TaxID=3154665 RepID=UPI0033299E2C
MQQTRPAAIARTLHSSHHTLHLLDAAGEVRQRGGKLTWNTERSIEAPPMIGTCWRMGRHQRQQFVHTRRIVAQRQHQPVPQQIPSNSRPAGFLDQSRPFIARQARREPPTQPAQPVGHRLLHTLHRAIRQTSAQPLPVHGHQGDHRRHEILDRHNPPPSDIPSRPRPPRT